MIHDSFVFDDSFWKTFTYIDGLSEVTSVKDILRTCEVTKNKFDDVLEFLNFFHYDYKIDMKDGEELFVPADEQVKIQFDLTLSEWIALQAHFPLMNEYASKEFHKTMAYKMGKVERENSGHDYFSFVDYKASKKPTCSFSELIKSAIKDKKCVSTFHHDGKHYDYYPHRVVYLDGELSVVAEDISERCLIFFKVDELKTVEIDHSEYQANYSSIEVNDFITAVRNVEGTDTRIVLKVTPESHIDFNPEFHFLGSPFLTTNLEGERIWAATIEPCFEFYQWLYQYKETVTVIEPQVVKEDFELFCEEFIPEYKNAG